MVPPPNAEGVEVTGLTDDQIERFIEYESITSIDELKAYANHATAGSRINVGVDQGLAGS